VSRLARNQLTSPSPITISGSVDRLVDRLVDRRTAGHPVGHLAVRPAVRLDGRQLPVLDHLDGPEPVGHPVDRPDFLYDRLP